MNHRNLHPKGLLFRLLVTLAVTALLGTGIALAQECTPASGQPLRVGVLPVMNTLPLFIAQQEGFYEAAGVTVELVPIESARDRSIGLQTGQLDVGNNDVMGAVLQVASGDELKIVRHDSFAAGVRFFSIVTSAQSGLDTPEALIQALKDDTAQIAIGHNTVTEYIATKLLRDAGYEPEANDYLEVSAIPLRLEQVAQGTVAAALLPEPLTTLATAVQGGTAVLNDSDIDFVPVALTVRQQVLDERTGDVCRFLNAYQQAVDAINADPEAYRDNEIRIPEPVQATYQVPTFREFRVPGPEELDLVQAWMVETGMTDAVLPWADLVDDRFVPAP
jgi:NitT/TauT family transport system substrate-binding protein